MQLALRLVPCCLLLSACGSPTGSLLQPHDTAHLESSGSGQWSVSVEWLSDPPAVGHVAAGKFHFTNAAGAEAEHADGVSASISMPSMDHHAHALQVSHDPSGSNAIWTFNDLEPSMAGDWVLHIQATVDEQKDTAEVPFSVPELAPQSEARDGCATR